MKKTFKLVIHCFFVLTILLLGYKIGVKRSMSPNSVYYYFKLFQNKLHGKNISYTFEDFTLPELTLEIQKKGKKKLDNKLTDVVNNHKGWMSSEIDPPKYIKASLLFQKKSIPVKVRLKGNTGNSLESNYSLRVKTRSDYFYNIKSFNLQPPHIKSYEDEWLFHSLAKEMKLFELNYFFVKLNINQISELYSIEEHFHHNLIHNNNLSPGVIICFEETVETLNYAHNQIASPRLGRASFYIAKIKPYYKKHVQQNDSLSTYYKRAKSLLEDFRNKKKTTSQVFDIHKLSKLFVLCDLLGNIHPLEYRNIKFYYNSSTDLIEPIPYDLNVGLKDLRIIAERSNKGIVGEIKDDYQWLKLVFNDTIFYRQYINNLDFYSNADLNITFKTSFSNLDSVKQIMRINPITSYVQKNHSDIIRRNQKYIKRKLKPFRVANCIYESSLNDSIHLVRIENIHDLAINVISYTNKSGDSFLITKLIDGHSTGNNVKSIKIEIHGLLQNLHSINFHVYGMNNNFPEKIEKD